MSSVSKYVIGGAVGLFLAWLLLPGWLVWLALIALVAVPVVGYLMLDPAQRARLKRIRQKRLER
ncbi:hypothetical protein [Rhizohabitans arisaemae]|uniref:hypothetical protein n=1 Tax=Rhizohabitans arisaemae TaxID=2720610 RepID=UPI0024B1843F|nr:hypothetical protein [Rhizohabitans arisaemae]